MRKKMLQNVIVLISTLVLSKLSGFVKEILMAHLYGVSNITDAYNVVLSLYIILFEGFTIAVCTSYISVIMKEGKSHDKVLEITSNIIVVLWLIVFFLSILATIFAKNVCAVFAVGFNEQTMDMTISMAKIVLPFTSLYVIRGILGGYLQTQGSFWYTGIGMGIMNIVLMISIILSHNNIYILAGGYVLAIIVVTVLGVVAAYKKGFRFTFCIDIKNHTLKKITKLAVPIFVSQVIVDFNLLVDRNFASVLGEGMVSIFNYANKLNGLFIAIFSQTFATIIFPEFSAIANEEKVNENFLSLLERGIKTALYIMIPIALFVCVTSEEIVDVVFGRGAFSLENVLVTGGILQIYALTLPFMTLTEIYTKAYYAIGRAKIPMMHGGVALAANIILNFILVHYGGYKGLALATLLSVIIQVILLGNCFDKSNGGNIIRMLLRYMGKCILASIPVGFVQLINNYIFSFQYNFIYKFALLGIEFLGFVGCYYIISIICKIDYTNNVEKIKK